MALPKGVSYSVGAGTGIRHVVLQVIIAVLSALQGNRMQAEAMGCDRCAMRGQACCRKHTAAQHPLLPAGDRQVSSHQACPTESMARCQLGRHRLSSATFVVTSKHTVQAQMLSALHWLLRITHFFFRRCTTRRGARRATPRASAFLCRRGRRGVPPGCSPSPAALRCRPASRPTAWPPPAATPASSRCTRSPSGCTPMSWAGALST